jgi:hypothetical protein
MRPIRPRILFYCFGIAALTLVFSNMLSVSATPLQPHPLSLHTTSQFLQLDSRLPVQNVTTQSTFTNMNSAFGSRFDFAVSPSTASVSSGTDGVYHDNSASYIVGITPSGQQHNFLFHMGTLHTNDAYLANEYVTQGLDTTRWEGDAPDGSGTHLTVDILSPFLGEAGCIDIRNCTHAVQDDTAPILIVGATISNTGTSRQAGSFLLGSNRTLPLNNACTAHITAGGTPVTMLTYDPSSDVTGGTLFLAGQHGQWNCAPTSSDRAGLSWNYSVAAGQTSTAYLILGGWNANPHLFANTNLPAGCQNEGLYAAQEWPTLSSLVDFSLDNLSTHDNLLGRAQSMENILIRNNTLSPAQRWLLGDTLRSYKADSWLTARQTCAGGGYDAAVYEGSFGFLSTVDVMHEYGYFEITHVPWFFKAAMSQILQNATSDTFGTYFQHDQGGDVDSNGNCTTPGNGVPTLRATCYNAPMPTEENANVALLLAYYAFTTGDTAFVRQYSGQLNAAMLHNQHVGDPNTGIAYNGQDTNTTYDAASDCLSNDGIGAGNQYYLGLKEAAAYRATAYLDTLTGDPTTASIWNTEATKIEGTMVQAYITLGYLPVAANNAFSNCSGRSITLGESLFYLHIIGLDRSMNATLLSDLAQQYPADVQASKLSSGMIAMTSTAATGTQCSTGHCQRYEWFSKVMLSGIVADIVYTRNGCTTCKQLNMVNTTVAYNLNLTRSFGDGIHEDGSGWSGYIYPRGIISWFYLNPQW